MADNSKLVSYAVVVAISENAAKLVSYAVLAGSENTSKLVSYAVVAGAAPDGAAQARVIVMA